MRTLLSTRDMQVRDPLGTWQEVSRELHIPIDLTRIGDHPFEGEIKVAQVGSLFAATTAFSPVEIEMSPGEARRSDRSHVIALSILRRGRLHFDQHGRATSHRDGDMMLIDNNAPSVSEFPDHHESLVIDFPREHLERVLGSARAYAGLTIEQVLPGASLARTFFDELMRVHDTLGPEMTARMTSIGTDLLVACIAERMAIDTPKPLQGTVTVQRAKAFIERNLGDPALDPPRVAAAMGVSLRHMHALFRERGRNIGGHIWHRRLDVAAGRLADPGYAHLSIGEVAYGCGFASQAHFSRRFRDRYDVSPTDYRQMAVAGHAG